MAAPHQGRPALPKRPVIFKADDDKPHCCPVCWSIPDDIWEASKPMRWWRIYTCRVGHRFTRLPFIGKDYTGE